MGAVPPGEPQELSSISRDWLERSELVSRKRLGQYLTPRPVAEALLDRVTLTPGMRVLDPGVGTGELLRLALDREPRLETVGWDVDESAIEAARELIPEASLEVRSALDATAVPEGSPEGFDLVIGNPPYFQLRLGPGERERFRRVISGRPNIFALFFQVGLEQLKPGGTLAYIVPPSMNSGAYFEALREHITACAEVEDLTILEGTDWFEAANTAVQLLVLRLRAKTPVGRIFTRGGQNPTHRVEGPFVFRAEVPEAGFRRVVLSSDPARLAAEFEGRRTLWELGLEASTGQVIWNENRGRLFEEGGPGRVPLVWSHSIGQGELKAGSRGMGASKAGKPSFYDTGDGGREPLTGPAIVVNRVVGAVGRGELRAALIPDGEQFLAENHVNVIRNRKAKNPGGSYNTQGWSESDPPRIEVDWRRVLGSLRAPDVAGRIRLLTGNTQISARELTHLLPLD